MKETENTWHEKLGKLPHNRCAKTAPENINERGAPRLHVSRNFAARASPVAIRRFGASCILEQPRFGTKLDGCASDGRNPLSQDNGNYARTACAARCLRGMRA
jgi:hypothetical protein